MSLELLRLQAVFPHLHQLRRRDYGTNHKQTKNLQDYIAIKGGSTMADTQIEQPCAVLVSTSLGSSFLDKKKRLTIARNGTVLDLKSQIHEKFPGSPPQGLQKLFYGFRVLDDTELVSNLTTLSPIPIILDMFSGTSAYNKTMSISQALEAYAALTAHSAYLSDKMRAVHVGNDILGEYASPNSSSTMDSPLYREMFLSINESIYNTYAEDIQEALILEMEPVDENHKDTQQWRLNQKPKSPLAVALAKEFDLNLRGMKTYGYLSILLVIFAIWGTNGNDSSTKLLLALIPCLWISKVRQIRVVYKLVLNIFLTILPRFGFLMQLFAAPYQVTGDPFFAII